MLSLILFATLSLFTYTAIDNVRDKSAEVMKDVEDSVYLVQNQVGRGTGWVTITKGGTKVMVTNVHVCDSPIPFMWTEKNGVRTLLRVLAKDSKHDICIMTAPTGAVPLKLAHVVHAEETVYAVGFPIIEFMSSNKGLTKGLSRLEIEYDTPLEKCKGKKHEIRRTRQQHDNGTTTVENTCWFVGTVLVTTANTDAGGSGSPILNRNEEVVAMVMVTTGNIAWGQGVPLSAIKEFLNKY